MMVMMHYRVVDVLFLRHFDINIHVDVDILLVDSLFIFLSPITVKEFLAVFAAFKRGASPWMVDVLASFLRLIAYFCHLACSRTLGLYWT